MAINHIVGDVFATTAPILGHGVNLKGDMGGGIAALIAKKWKDTVYLPYEDACNNGGIALGGVLPTQTEGEGSLWVFNMATQVNPGRDARLEALKDSLAEAVNLAEEMGFDHMALPRIGAGIGGLTWDEVLNVIEAQSATSPHFVFDIYSLPEPAREKSGAKKVHEVNSLSHG